jgi:hypothetical protein
MAIADRSVLGVSAAAPPVAGSSARTAFVRYWAVLVFVLVATAVAVEHPYVNEPVIRSDGLGYHAWTRAILDGHVSFCEYRDLEAVGAITRDPTTGRCPNKYAPGLAILRFPVMGPITALNGGELRSAAEDHASEILSIVAGAIALLGMLVAAQWLRVRAWIANAAALAVAFGTGLFHYATFDGSFTHVYSAAAVALLLALGVRLLVTNDDDPERVAATKVRDGVLTFVLAAALVSIRVPSVLVLGTLAIAAEVVVRRDRPALRPRLVAMYMGAGGALVVILGGLVAYNRFMRGVWSLSSYADEDFLLDQLKQLDVLGGFHKGLVTWYPIVVVVVVAAVLARAWSGLALLVGLVLPLATLYGAWHSWDLGGGFGHRGFVELAPAFALVFAVALERLTGGVRAGVLVAGAVAVMMTLGLLAAYWNGEASFYGIDGGEWVRFTVGERSFPVVVSDWVTGR